MCSLGVDDERNRERNNGDRLLPLRSAVILLAGLFVGSVAGFLSMASKQSVAESVLAAGGAFATATVFFDQAVSTRRH